MEIRKGTARELDELAALYNAVCGALEAGINYPGWRRDIYPTREDAERGVAAGELYVAVEQGAIVGTMILRQGQEPGYRTARWGRELTDSDGVYVCGASRPCRQRGGRRHAGLCRAAGCRAGQKGAAAGCLREKHAGHAAV